MNKKSEYIKKYRNKQKKELVNLLGGKCSRCGYSKCLRALSFHHVNDKTMSLNQSNGLAFAKRAKEAKNCILLCENCHSELHELNGASGEIRTHNELTLSG